MIPASHENFFSNPCPIPFCQLSDLVKDVEGDRIDLASIEDVLFIYQVSTRYVVFAIVLLYTTKLCFQNFARRCFTFKEKQEKVN